MISACRLLFASACAAMLSLIDLFIDVAAYADPAAEAAPIANAIGISNPVLLSVTYWWSLCRVSTVHFNSRPTCWLYSI